MFEMQPAPQQPVQQSYDGAFRAESLTTLLGGTTKLAELVEREIAGYAQVTSSAQAQTQAATDTAGR